MKMWGRAPDRSGASLLFQLPLVPLPLPSDSQNNRLAIITNATLPPLRSLPLQPRHFTITSELSCTLMACTFVCPCNMWDNRTVEKNGPGDRASMQGRHVPHSAENLEE